MAHAPIRGHGRLSVNQELGLTWSSINRQQRKLLACPHFLQATGNAQLDAQMFCVTIKQLSGGEMYAKEWYTALAERSRLCIICSTRLFIVLSNCSVFCWISLWGLKYAGSRQNGEEASPRPLLSFFFSSEDHTRLHFRKTQRAYFLPNVA